MGELCATFQVKIYEIPSDVPSVWYSDADSTDFFLESAGTELGSNAFSIICVHFIFSFFIFHFSSFFNNMCTFHCSFLKIFLMYRISNGVVLEFGINCIPSLKFFHVCLLSKIRKRLLEKEREKYIFPFLFSWKDRWSRFQLPSVKYAVDYKSMKGGYKPY